MIKATIEMNDHTIFEHKFKGEKEFEYWKRLNQGQFLKAFYQPMSKSELEKLGLKEEAEETEE